MIAFILHVRKAEEIQFEVEIVLVWNKRVEVNAV
jgi:hypothetical protein